MPTTDIKIHISVVFTLAVIITVVASLITIYSLSVMLAWKLLLTLATLSYGWKILWQECLLKSKHSVTRLFLNHDGWQITTPHQQWQGQLLGESTLTAPVSVLRFKVAGRRRKLSCIICCDSIEQNSYRQLLVLLRTTHAREAEEIRRKRSVIK